MTSIAQSQNPSPQSGLPAQAGARPSRLLAGIYHDIGMAAVASCLDLPVDSLEPDAHQAVKRGARYIYLMPKRPETSTPAA